MVILMHKIVISQIIVILFFAIDFKAYSRANIIKIFMNDINISLF